MKKSIKSILGTMASAVLAFSSVNSILAAESGRTSVPSAIKGVVLLGETPDESCDVNGDGTVNVFDLMRYKYRMLNPSAEPETYTGQLVYRAYRSFSECEPDPAEADQYIQRLESGELTVSDMILEFMNSPEYTSRDISDEEYISSLYEVFLGRSPDTAGLNGWCNRIRYVSRRYALYGFCVSSEFTGKCTENSITPGRPELTEARDRNTGLAQTAGQMYSRVLGTYLSGDRINSLVQDLTDGNLTLQTAAFGIADDEAFSSLEMSDDEFIRTVYQAFTNSDAGDDTVSYYSDKLSSGSERADVLRLIAASEETYLYFESLNMTGYNRRAGSNFRMSGVWHHLAPSGKLYQVEDSSLLQLLDYSERILNNKGRGLDEIYYFCCSDSGYKYMEKTKTIEQIESIGWTYFADYAMNNYYSVCYYMAAQMDILLDLAGYQCRVVHATHGSGDHYWNQIYVDGRWTNYDVTNRWQNKTWDEMVALGDYILIGYADPEYR